MTTTQASPDDFLYGAYKALEFESGAGCIQLTDSSIRPDLNQVGWVKQARGLGAQAIFFVQDYPTVLFFKLDVDLEANTQTIENQIRQLHVRTWNASRVPLFFVALPGELRVYSAYQKPVRDPVEWRAKDRWLERVEIITQVAERLQDFSRPAIESGQLFQKRQEDFERGNRVDLWLLRNLRLLRKELEQENQEKRQYIHALIGRSIFIRYLEDRKILVEDYFADATVSRKGKYRCYTDVLASHDDTCNLFRKLRVDFNGDLFPLSPKEENEINGDDLLRLQDFLVGRGLGNQADLFFWAYRFDIIPIELISNIYEEFYHEHGAEDVNGTHYTPTALVDFVLSQCLTTERLDAGARVLDPACGSGVFLVEAFKRMVHYECRRQGVDHLSRSDLTKLLMERLVGIDVNQAAVQIAAFSLYLAFLDFRNPPDIRKHKQLPKLVYHPDQSDGGKSLFHANAFYLTSEEKSELHARLSSRNRYKGRAEDERVSKTETLPLEDSRFDLIVGNPPWGTGDSSDDQIATEWCKAFRYAVGDRELSQCFMWRSQRLLEPGGEIGLLVSSSAFFNTTELSNEDNGIKFRQQWLKRNCIRAVYNFSHMRHVFFRKQKTGPLRHLQGWFEGCRAN